MKDFTSLVPPVAEVSKHKFDLGPLGGGTLYIVRDDLIHPLVSGNKMRKLCHQLPAHTSDGLTIASGGGPWSNHLLALGYICHAKGWSGVCHLRGHLHTSNAFIDLLRRWGMDVRPLDRHTFDALVRNENGAPPADLTADTVWIPPGGDNDLGVQGCRAVCSPWPEPIPVEVPWVIAAGYGTTALGILSSWEQATRDSFIISAIPTERAMTDLKERLGGVDMLDDAHVACLPCGHGPFGRIDDEGIAYLSSFYKQTGVLLDPLYNGKALLTYLAHRSDDRPFVLYHSGGVMGWLGIKNVHAEGIHMDIKRLIQAR